MAGCGLGRGRLRARRCVYDGVASKRKRKRKRNDKVMINTGKQLLQSQARIQLITHNTFAFVSWEAVAVPINRYHSATTAQQHSAGAKPKQYTQVNVLLGPGYAGSA